MDNVFSERYKTLFESGKGRYIETDVIRNTIKKLNERQQNTLFTKYPEIETFIKKPDQRMSLQTVKNTMAYFELPLPTLPSGHFQFRAFCCVYLAARTYRCCVQQFQAKQEVV